MKKEFKFDYNQKKIIQEILEFKKEIYKKTKILMKKAADIGLESLTFILKEDGTLNKIYYSDLLTEEEKKIIEFDMKKKLNVLELKTKKLTK